MEIQLAEESSGNRSMQGRLGLALPTAISPSQKSFFVVGLHKAGSTLLTNLFSRLALGYRYVPYNLHQAIYDRSLLNQDVSISPEDFFEPFGYAFIGFRGWNRGHGLPSWSKQRVVQLVRDPRDVLVSMYFSISMSHTVPRSTMQREAFDRVRRIARELDIDGFVLKCAN